MYGKFIGDKNGKFIFFGKKLKIKYKNKIIMKTEIKQFNAQKIAIIDAKNGEIIIANFLERVNPETITDFLARNGYDVDSQYIVCDNLKISELNNKKS